MARSRAATEASVLVTTRGEVDRSAVEQAEGKIRHVIGYATQPVLAVRALLTMAPDPAIARPARAEATLDVSGTQIRATATAADMREAIDLLGSKLEQNLLQHQDRDRTRHRWMGVASEHQWRRGGLPTRREAWFPRPPEEREVVRRKTFELEPMTSDEAAFEMDLLGHDFYLFKDATSSHDAVVFRDGEGNVAVRGEAVLRPDVPPGLEVVRTAPTLSEREAIGRLEVSGEPFVFYLDPATARGRVLYLRYDGHYGLISSAR